MMVLGILDGVNDQTGVIVISKTINSEDTPRPDNKARVYVYIIHPHSDLRSIYTNQHVRES